MSSLLVSSREQILLWVEHEEKNIQSSHFLNFLKICSQKALDDQQILDLYVLVDAQKKLELSMKQFLSTQSQLEDEKATEPVSHSPQLVEKCQSVETLPDCDHVPWKSKNKKLKN